MKVSTVKKIIMLADGFAYNDDLEAYYMQGSTWAHFKYIRQWEFYPILLYRAVWGWNDSESLEILITMEYVSVECFDDDSNEYWYHQFTKTDYLTPEEQAIETCLIELLENG